MKLLKAIPKGRQGNRETTSAAQGWVSDPQNIWSNTQIANLFLYERLLPLPPQSMQVDARELTIRTIYSHTNIILVFEPNLPYLCDMIRLPKQETVDHYHNYLTKLLPNYRPHVSAYKSQHHPSDMWVSMYNHVDTHILAGGT